MYKHVYYRILLSDKTLKINAYQLTKSRIWKKLQGIHTKEYYAAIRKKKIL